MATKVWYINAETGAKLTDINTVVTANVADVDIHKVTQKNSEHPVVTLWAKEGTTVTDAQITAAEAEQDAGAVPSFQKGDTYGTKPALTAAAAAAPAGGTGAAAGGWDTANNRDAAITTINNLRTRVNEMEAALKNAGILR